MTYRAWNLKPLDRAALRELTQAIAEQATEELEYNAQNDEPWSEQKYAAALAAQQKENALLAGVLTARGITDPTEALTLLAGEEELSDPSLLTDMDKACERIWRAIDEGETIVVFGDYDVDGVTATALLYQHLKGMGATVKCMLPSREGDGYGLSKNAIQSMHNKGCTLIVTVDNGISAVEEADYAAELGIDLIITDHHLPPETLPKAIAVVDPRREDDTSPFKGLCGAGVAFKLCAALDKHVCAVEFAQQERAQLVNWLRRRFTALGHDIDSSAADHLLFTCGTLMTDLVPEIEKIAAYAKQERITIDDINAVADPVLDARVFDMTNCVTAGKYDDAARVLADLLRMQTEPIAILAALGKELRKLYTARMALDSGKDRFWLKQLWSMSSDYPAKLLLQAAKKVDHDWCSSAVIRCQRLDRRMKSERGMDSEAELKLFLMELAGVR